MITKDRITELFDNRGLRGPVLKLLSGTGIAFLLSYVAKIILLKLYAPADFGIFAFVAAIVSILAPLTSFRYEDALMLPEDDRTSAHVFLLAMASAFVMSVAIVPGVLFSDEIAMLFGDPAVSPWVWTIPVVLLVSRTAKISELWLTRKERFGLVSAGQVLHSAAMTVSRISLGLIRPNPGGLILGFALGFVAMIGVFLRSLVSSLRIALQDGFDRRLLRAVASRYRRFPMFTMPATLMGAGVSHLPAILLLYYFESTTLGIYSQSVAVLFIPLSQVGSAVAQVFFVRAVKARRRQALEPLTTLVHKRLVALSLFPAGVAMLAGGDLFQFVFGPTWRPAGEFLLYLAPWLCLSAIASPLTRLFDVLERQRMELATTAIMLVIVTGALVAGGRTGDIETTLLYLGMGGSAVRIGQIVLLLRLAGVHAQMIVRPYLVYGLYCSILFGVLAFAVGLGSTFVTFLATVGLSMVYAGIILQRDQLLAARRDLDKNDA